MRKRGKWMKSPDDSILEYIRDNGSGNPSDISDVEEIRFSYGYIADRCSVLAEYGLLERLGNAVYVLTDEGESYLDEELDTGTLSRNHATSGRSAAV